MHQLEHADYGYASLTQYMSFQEAVEKVWYHTITSLVYDRRNIHKVYGQEIRQDKNPKR